MRIFLDDVRNPPNATWLVMRTASDAYFWIRNSSPDVEIIASLDHDLGDNVPTGYDLLNWIERDIAMDGFRPNIVFAIHSANPVGRQNMERAIESIRKMLDKPES